MTLRNLTICVAGAGVVLLAGSFAIAQQAKEGKPGTDMPPLPAGWTESDMQACMAAGIPGKQHAHLARDAGVWQGKNTMWMGPGTEPVVTDCTTTVTSFMEGRFTKCEVVGEMPGMGPFNGFGLYGFDNVTQKFVSTWVDNCGTGIMVGTGELSDDGKTLTWNYTYTCPITKKPTVMREVETTTGPNAKKLEMFGADPKTGEEYMMMRIESTRK